MTTRFSRRAMACALLATSFLASGAAADIAPPPQHNSVSPMGVSYSNGAFNLSETDLSIGGEGNAGLSFTRTYNSATGGLFSDFLFTPGWTHNFTGAVTQIPVPTNPDDPPPQHQLYTYTVSFGGRSASFAKGLGTYIPDEPNGSSLIYVTSPSPGHYTFTDSDGSVANFTDGQNGRLKDVTFPDGTRWEFVRDSNLNLQRVTSNRGYAMIVEYLAGNARKICAVNLAETYWTSSTSCPAGGRSVTYGYTNSTYRPSLLLLATKTDTAGQVTSYGYNFYEHVNCIKEPGQSICRVQNTYSTCPEDPNIPGIEPDVHLREGVLSQTTADGKQYSYSYDDQYVCTNGYAPTISTTDPLSGVTVVDAGGGQPTRKVDPLNRTWLLGYDTSGAVSQITYPEGNQQKGTVWDDRGNPTEVRLIAKPGSGLADIVETRVYPATCTNVKTCNKPTSKTDARGNTTDFTYDPTHGGLLTETGPAVNGVRPQKRFTYVQRYAWIKDSGGGYVQAATPAWLLASESFCRNSAATGNPGAPCATSGDEVVTSYDYGPDSGPNNLLLRGKVVTADGTSRRTCFTYDSQGNRIAETSPRAGLATCS